MIVSENAVGAALAYLGDEETAARTRFDVVTAENKAKEIFARLYLSYQGTITERESRATCNPEFQETKAVEAEAIRELERHKAQVKSAEMLIEIFRTENANARAAERVR
jgi:hypothetical protein